MRALAALLLALVVACSSAPAPTRCTPGASVACVCPGVGTGAQVCAADGSSYGACACGVDAGVGDTSVTPGADATSGADVAVAVVDVPALDVVTAEDRPAAVDAVAVADAGPNRGTLHQACRAVGAPCADGSECLLAVGWQREDSPHGICAYRCIGLPLPPPCADVTDAGVQQVCVIRNNMLNQCLRRCSGSGQCLASTRCGSIAPGPGQPPTGICIPENDP